jgi:hypothetical protein
MPSPPSKIATRSVSEENRQRTHHHRNPPRQQGSGAEKLSTQQGREFTAEFAEYRGENAEKCNDCS